MKILNLYAGIGGNRKLWGSEHQITAVEYKPAIAAIYKDHFPNDTVIVGDAHQYLLEHYGEFDFIWSSPPCPTHTTINKANVISPYKDNTKQIANGGAIKPRYPDMALYQEIIFLTHFFKGKFCVENVKAYYEPLIPPVEIGGHWFWVNFMVSSLPSGGRAHDAPIEAQQERKGFDLTKYKGVDKRLLLRNCVEPEVGRHILKYVENPIITQRGMF
jgi:DNA (cytosine-5)-methyltransferase 1